MKVRVLVMIMAAAIFLLSACESNEIEDAVYWPISDFIYTDQNGEPYGLKDLDGKVWVANFIFTNCDDVCLPMTANMKKLQDRTKEEGIENIQFVSLSVDPTVDTPEILKDFGTKFSADFSNWHFLTGYTQEEIETFAFNTFKTPVKKPENEDQVIHGTNFYLIDGNGQIMKYYSGLADIPMDDIINDIKKLQ